MNEATVPSLREVQAAFIQWRERGQPRRTPLELREQAVALLAQHTMREVMQALRVDHRRLSGWRRALRPSPGDELESGFVELPVISAGKPARAKSASAPASATLTLTRQAGDGRAVSVAGELPAEHWRWALRLLEEAAL